MVKSKATLVHDCFDGHYNYYQCDVVRSMKMMSVAETWGGGGSTQEELAPPPPKLFTSEIAKEFVSLLNTMSEHMYTKSVVSR